MGHHLCIRLGYKGAAMLHQGGAQAFVIFDDAVVNDGDVALHVGVWMSVQVAGLAVGGPAGVADADAPVQRCAGQALLQVGQAAFGLHQADFPAVHHRDARAVIPAVLQAGKPLQQDGLRLLASNISNNTTHWLKSSFG